MADWFFLAPSLLDEMVGYMATFVGFGLALSAVTFAVGYVVWFVICFFKGV